MVDPSFGRQLREVALERVRRIRGYLVRRTPELRAEALREAHTLKGEARITGRADVATVAHELEGGLEASLPEAELEALLVALEGLVRERAPAAAPVKGSMIEQTLLRVELGQVAELTRACSELRAVEQATSQLARDLAALATAPPASRGARRRRLRELARRGSEIAFLADQRTEVLEQDLRDLRMLPVARLFEPLAHHARQIANDLDKPIEVEVGAGTARVDRQVLDQVSEPLLHLIRNAVDHGLEPIEARVRADKPAVGTLRLGAEPSGREVRLYVEDDGRGVDLPSVRRRAVERGLWTQEQAREADRDAALGMLFEPGFSTRDSASQLSGRGLGLDIVRRRAEALGGAIAVESSPGRGTRFAVTVPVSLVADPVVPFEVDGAVYALATSEVALVREMATVTPGAAGEASVVRIDGERAIPLWDLGALLGGAPAPRRDALLVLSLGAEIALAVDRLLPVTPAVRQALDPFLEGVALVRATVDVSGRLVALLDGRELARRAARVTAPVRAAAGAPAATSRPRILVVDDSELTRDVLVAMLAGLGYEVLEAVDGARALEVLARGPVDLVLTDIDMPVLDGLALCRQIRSTPATAGLPIVVLTTRAAATHLEAASAAGADAYLTKTAFSTDELARLVARHTGGGA